MVSSDYIVASASKLLGTKPTVRRAGPEDKYSAWMKGTDDTNREASWFKRADHVTKAVRFAPSTRSLRIHGLMPEASSDSTQDASFAFSRATTTEDGPSIERTATGVQKLQSSFDELPAPVRSSRPQQQIAFDPPFSSPSRSGSIARRCGRQEIESNEIYSSSIDAMKSQAFLGSPQSSPPLTPINDDETPTKEIGEYQSLAAKLTLTTQQVDQLVTAMVYAPLVHRNMKKQPWTDMRGDMLVSSPPSTVSTGSEKEPPNTPTPKFYSQPNQPFLSKDPTTPAYLEDVALTDPSIHGSPIRFAFKFYQQDSENLLKIGACSYLKPPSSVSGDCSLHVLPPSSEQPHSRVLLQVIGTVLECSTGRRKYLLIAAVDVTARFMEAALTELAGAVGVDLGEMDVLLPAVDGVSEKRVSEGSIDWCAFASELDKECSVMDHVESTALGFAKLKAETCSTQTLSLISELERIRVQHSEFIVLQPTHLDEAGRPGGIKTPFISQSLQQRLCPGVKPTASESARAFRHDLVAALGPSVIGEEEFWTRFWWGGAQRYVRCVPLVDGVFEKTAFWVCFVVGTI